MVNKPPHLPLETCRVDTHHKLLNLRWILFIFFIAAFSSVTTALITVAWLSPMFTPTDYYGIGRENKDFVHPDATIVKQTRQKVLDIFDRRKITDKDIYSAKAFVSKAAILSSDGWAVTYYSDYLLGEEKNWDVLDYQGITYKVQKSFFDPVSQLFYFKVSGEGFRVVSFLSSNNLNSENYFWSLDRDFTVTNLLEEEIDISKTISIWQPIMFWRISEKNSAGNLFFANSGELAGMTGDEQVFIPAWVMQNQLSSLLSKQKVSYSGFPARGYFVSNIKVDNIWKEVFGFYVLEANNSGFNKGDVILKINGQDISPKNLSEQVLNAPEESEVQVIRKGEEIKLIIKKQIIK